VVGKIGQPVPSPWRGIRDGRQRLQLLDTAFLKLLTHQAY
jgi:hypothetical protein